MVFRILKFIIKGSPFNIINYFYEFKFVKWIKSGGYGEVFLARHVLIKDFYVAIKKIDISDLTTDEIYNISREALYLESFKHKNIIKFINSYIYENHFYTIMDYAYGGELTNYLSEKKVLSEMDCKRIFKQLHDAVNYIHTRNVIHRDLKPNNILFLDKNYQNLVLIDFGISGYNSGNIKETVKAGTTKFIPPELAAGLTYSSTPKVDIWALGIILYLMLFGSFPFDSTKESDIIQKIINDNHKFPSHITISKSGYNLINSLLEKNHQLRIQMNSPLFDEWYNNKCSNIPLIKEIKKTDSSNCESETVDDNSNNYIQNNLINIKIIKNNKYKKDVNWKNFENEISSPKYKRTMSISNRQVPNCLGNVYNKIIAPSIDPSRKSCSKYISKNSLVNASINNISILNTNKKPIATKNSISGIVNFKNTVIKEDLRLKLIKK